jgi:putative ABC transport system permease protein
MKYFPLVWAGVWRKKGRTILTLLSVANAFLLFGLLQGFVAGLDAQIAETHADVLITANRVSQVEQLPMSLLPQIRNVSGVRAVSPVAIFHGTYRLPTQFVRGFAVDPQALKEADAQSTIPQSLIAKLVVSRTGALVPSTVAKQYGWKVGDRIPITSFYWTNRDGSAVWPVDIVGIYPTNDQDVFFGNALLANYDYLDEGRVSQKGTSTVFLVRVKDPEKASEIGMAIDRGFANSPYETKTASERQLAQDSVRQIGDVGLVVRLIMGAVFFALLFSVGAVMMQSVRERTPELAVLKTVGFSDNSILVLIVAESLLLCVVAAGIGLGLATALAPAIQRLAGFDIHPGPAALIGLLLAVVLAIVTGLPPAVRGMRLQVVDALAGR